MPNKTQLSYIVSKSSGDLKNVRIPGVQKPLEQLTIGELVQLRPGGEVEDNYTIDAVTSDISVTTSKLLNELARTQGELAIKREVVASKLRGPGAVHEIITKLPGR